MPAKGLAGSRKKEKSAWLEEGLQGDVGATCGCRKNSPCGTAVSLVSPDDGRITPCVCVPCGEIMTMERSFLTQGKEEVIKISDAHTFSIGLHSETSLPKGQAKASASSREGLSLVVGCALFSLLV